jgi:GGDEF domain-containing protein
VAAVGERLGLEPQRREQLVFGSLLHDIGKLGISERILLKPARLTPEERAIIELHPRIGYRLVSRIAALEPIAAGRAAPPRALRRLGLSRPAARGADPARGADRRVADAFSAMTQERPYQAADDRSRKACAELERVRGHAVRSRGRARVRRRRRARAPELWAEGEVTGELGEALADTEIAAAPRRRTSRCSAGAMAIIDNLTLLYSHRYMHEAAAAEAQRADVHDRPFSLLLISLVGLPEINEREGHAAGRRRHPGRRPRPSSAPRRGAREPPAATRADRLALLIPGADGPSAERCLEQMLEDWPPDVELRCATATWQGGEKGSDVIERGRRELMAAMAPPALPQPPAPVQPPAAGLGRPAHRDRQRAPSMVASAASQTPSAP